MTVIERIILIYCLVALVICAISLANGLWEVNLFPNELYKTTKLNRLGSVIVSILLFICFPYVYIAQVVKFLFTVGKKDN